MSPKAKTTSRGIVSWPEDERPAQQEVDDAVVWYDEQSLDLGREFLDELDRAVRRMRAFPAASPEIAPGIRR